MADQAWARFTTGLHRALEGQAFRQVPLTELVATPLRLPGVGAEVDAALRVVANDDNWVEITRQLVQLRTRAFIGLHLRRDEYDLEVVPIYAWSGGLTFTTVDEHLDWVHTVITRIQRALADFTLDERHSAVLDQALTRLQAPVRSIVEIIIDINRATMPNTTMLAVDSDGLDPALAARFDQAPHQRSSTNPLVIGNRPVSFGALVDGRTGSVHGHNDWFSLDLPELGRGLRFLAAHG
ncbi:hypothetical protein ACFQV2_18295 [Actinokineospora soli]|uniref:Uncharacterized protein n=1 Tax=Actinokineospora soli TaxID=1048753 RepID=A0ABW2TN22_9PSEU